MKITQFVSLIELIKVECANDNTVFAIWPRGYNHFFHIHSTEQEMYPAHKYLNAQTIGISTIVSKLNTTSECFRAGEKKVFSE